MSRYRSGELPDGPHKGLRPARPKAATRSPPAGAVAGPEVPEERRPGEQVLAELAEIAVLAAELGVSNEADFDTGLTTDDMLR